MSEIGKKITATLGRKPQEGDILKWTNRAGYTYTALALGPGEVSHWFTSARNEYFTPLVTDNKGICQVLEAQAVEISVVTETKAVQ